MESLTILCFKFLFRLYFIIFLFRMISTIFCVFTFDHVNIENKGKHHFKIGFILIW